MEFSTTNRGQPCLLFNGYRFTKMKEKKCGEVVWRCVNRTCNGKLVTSNSDIIKEDTHNTCVPDVAAINVHKARAREKSDRPISQDISEAGRPEVNKSYSAKAKEIMMKLQQEYDDLIQSFNVYSEQMKENNDLQSIEQANKEAYAKAAGTSCADIDDPSDDIYSLKMLYFIQCQKSLTPEMLDGFSKKIDPTKFKVEEIENTLQAKCTSDPNSCDEAKKKASGQLSLILTPEFDAKLKSDASDVLKKYKTSMDECFNKKITDDIKKFLQITEDINECLAKNT